MFVYSQDNKSFYKCLNEYDGTFTKIYDDSTRLEWIEKQLIPPGYFVLTDGSMNLGGRKEGFLMVQNFP